MSFFFVVVCQRLVSLFYVRREGEEIVLASLHSHRKHVGVSLKKSFHLMGTWGNMETEMWMNLWTWFMLLLCMRGNDSLIWLCIKLVHEWPVCWSKYCSTGTCRCSSVYFLCVDPFCWTWKTQTKRNYQYTHYIRRSLWLIQCVARYCWPKLVVYYAYNMSEPYFFLPVFCRSSASLLPVFGWYLY